jgi:polysaccharide biosynthesis protein PslJ
MTLALPSSAPVLTGVLAPNRGPDPVTWLTFYSIVLFAIPSRLVIGPLGSAGAISMVLGLLSLGIWVLMHLSRAHPTLSPYAQPVRWSVGVFMFAVGVSYALAMSGPLNSDEFSPADVAILSLLSWSGTLLLAHDGIPTLRRLDVLVWRLAQLGGLLGVLGLAQFFFRRAFVDLIAIPGLTAVADASLFYRNGLPRPAGTAIHPIEYGAILTMLLPLALHIAITRMDRAILLRWFPAVAITGAIVVSSSRSAYLGALVGIIVCGLSWTRRVRVRILVVAVIALGIVALALPRLLASIVGLFAGAEEDPSISSRTDSFGFAWSFIAEHPLFGRGLGTFLPKYRIFDNQYLGMLVSIGVVGTLALLAVAVVSVLVLVRVFRTARDPQAGALAISLSAAILAGFVSLAFFDAFAFPMTMGTLFLILGVAGALGRITESRPPAFW